ncbi:MAG: 3-deoxy-D-manno-octulosonic acid transferase [Flavobacteriales bacterium]
MRLVYNISIWLFIWSISIAAVWNKKAALLLVGHKNWLFNLTSWRSKNQGQLIWFHCASLGEFEQGRPLMEAIRKSKPDVKILLTFFSPSGYEVRKNYDGADYICYLPADTPAHAKSFIQAAAPTSIYFIKYEYWANYFFAAKQQGIPLFVASAILRPEQRFFGVFRSFWQKVLQCVTHFYVQNENTKLLLSEHGFSNVTISGDTRFDRVLSISNGTKTLPEIEQWKQHTYCIAGGSTWPADDVLLLNYWKHCAAIGVRIKLIIAPHEIDADHINSLKNKIPAACLWSEMQTGNFAAIDCLIIDTIGLLSTLYQYADAVHIGGGFGKGIHNTLEAAAWGKPITFGPRYQKFDEAKALIENGAALSIHTSDSFINAHDTMRNDAVLNRQMAAAALALVQQNAGASNRILQHSMPTLQM